MVFEDEHAGCRVLLRYLIRLARGDVVRGRCLAPLHDPATLHDRNPVLLVDRARSEHPWPRAAFDLTAICDRAGQRQPPQILNLSRQAGQSATDAVMAFNEHGAARRCLRPRQHT